MFVWKSFQLGELRDAALSDESDVTSRETEVEVLRDQVAAITCMVERFGFVTGLFVDVEKSG